MRAPQRIVARSALLKDGWAEEVMVEIAPDGTIAAVRPAEGSAEHVVDLLLPAPVNVHSHTFQRALAGLVQGRSGGGQDSFWSWRDIMYRLVACLTPEQLEAIAAMAFVEMLEAGYGSVVEFHYLHHAPGGQRYAERAELSARIVQAAERTGIGLTLLPVLYQRGGADGRPLAGAQLRFGNDVDGFAELIAGARRLLAHAPADFRLGVAPHSLRAVDAVGIEAALALAPQGPIHIHLAEQPAEVEEICRHLGAPPVRWLLDHAPVDGRWCAIHCTHMSDGESTRLAASGAVVGLCPVTEADLGDGIFAATHFLAVGGRIAVGTDSHVRISLVDELRWLEYGQRLREHCRAALADSCRSSGRRLFDLACAGGAQAAARPSGAIAPGLLADLVAIDTDNPWLCGRRGDAVLDSFIFAAPDRMLVREVWSAGRHVVRGGRHLQRELVEAAFRRALRELGLGA